MIVVDVNVLVAAFRQDHPHHLQARPWIENVIASREQLVVPDAVWLGFVRIVTNSRVFPVTSTVAEAFEFVDAVCSAPGYLAVPGHLDGLTAFRDLCLTGQVAGNLIPDAYIASIALSYGCPVASFDRDFRRFDRLQIVVPT